MIEQFKENFAEEQWDSLFDGKPDGKLSAGSLGGEPSDHTGSGNQRGTYLPSEPVHLLQSGVPFFSQGITWQKGKSWSVSGNKENEIKDIDKENGLHTVRIKTVYSP